MTPDHLALIIFYAAFFFTVIFLSSGASIGFYAACQFEDADIFDKADKEVKRNWQVDQDSKMIFWWIRRYLGPYVSYYWSKPLYSCIICMASVHSVMPLTVMMWLLGLAPVNFLILWPLVAIVTAGLNKHISLLWDNWER